MKNIFPPFKNTMNKKKGIDVVLITICYIYL